MREGSGPSEPEAEGEWRLPVRAVALGHGVAVDPGAKGMTARHDRREVRS